jgi:transmembrane sensor
MTKQLFQKYLDGVCTAAEGREVEQWLRTCSTAEADALLQKYWHDQQVAMPPERMQALWTSLSDNIAPVQPKVKLIRPLYWKIAAAAAVVILFTGWGWMQLRHVQPAHRPPVAARKTTPAATITPATAVPEWVQVENQATAPKKVLLQDGSEVMLYAHSRLQYVKNFETNRRDIQLEGKGLFTVAKDKQRPFTVYSRDIATTAVGTIFLVNTFAHKQYISVQLLEGRIIVRPVKTPHKDSVVLRPGEEVKYHIKDRSLVVKAPATIHHSNSTNSTGDTLSFTHVPLYEVFDKLKLLHHVQIVYTKAEMASMNFTGTIARSDSLRMVLTAIAQMNGLTVRENEGTFTVLTTGP